MKLILCFFVLCFRIVEGWRHLIPAIAAAHVYCDNPPRLCEMVVEACGMVVEACGMVEAACGMVVEACEMAVEACENSRDVVRNSPGLFFLTRRPRKNSPGLLLTTTKTTSDNLLQVKQSCL